MVEKHYPCAVSNNKVIERILEDDHAAVNHMLLPTGTALPEHFANSHVYMIVARGAVTLRLDDQPDHTYAAPSVITIPFGTKMNAGNHHPDLLELFVVKAPAPAAMGGR